MLVILNVHAINPNYIFFNGTESKNDSKGQRKGWKVPVPCPPLSGSSKYGIFDTVMA